MLRMKMRAALAKAAEKWPLSWRETVENLNRNVVVLSLVADGARAGEKKFAEKCAKWQEKYHEQEEALNAQQAQIGELQKQVGDLTRSLGMKEADYQCQVEAGVRDEETIRQLDAKLAEVAKDRDAWKVRYETLRKEWHAVLFSRMSPKDQKDTLRRLESDLRGLGRNTSAMIGPK